MRAAAAAAFVVLALAASGCGSGVGRAVSGSADTSNGKKLYVEKCGICHTLQEANTSGTTTTGTTPSGGGGGGANAAAGKDAFNSNGCGSCHTLAAAGSSGKIGPDLDKLKSYASAAKKPLEDFTHESIVDANAYVE